MAKIALFPNILQQWMLVLLLSFLWFIPSSATSKGDSPDLLLAKIYQGNIDISEYWISEKYDGVRAYWNGKNLLSRNGNIYHAPAWFTDGFPQRKLDGELWIGRGQFQQLVSTVRKDVPIDDEWRNVTYMVFELPGAEGTFTDRLVELKWILAASNHASIKLVPQYRLDSESALRHKLQELVAKRAEGLMLHRASAVYKSGRSDDLLKLKPHLDAEATVIKHLPGKGKYTGMTGSLLVETKAGIQFRIGTGLSDAERRNPPPIGALVTYKYHGKTNSGKPRFASFLRVRKYD